ncbi:hypothetical protein ColTof4_14044 [Colletotrichum tofieldiae]|nr:hypothetical protein ColTof3_14679 [Colletotrichum tofieldiae]GKT81621.1 hypothetical protein ColTof4_14044 [Colletotrichum tofieldiae]GKT97595.1 hypothetical protein Ct61P_15445 [Colletotrichum tofieldiae]
MSAAAAVLRSSPNQDRAHNHDDHHSTKESLRNTDNAFAVSRLADEARKSLVQEETIPRYTRLGKENGDKVTDAHGHVAKAQLELWRANGRIRELQSCVTIWPMVTELLVDASAA